MIFKVLYSKQPLQANGALNGLITVFDTADLVVGATVFISSDTQAPVQGIISQIVSKTQLYCRPVAPAAYTNLSVSNFLMADNAVLTQPAQEFTGFDEQYGEVRILDDGTPTGVVNTFNFKNLTVSVSGDKATIEGVAAGAGITKAQADDWYLPRLGGAANGFVDKNKCSLVWDEPNRTLSINRIVDYDIYSNGVKVTITENKSAQILNESGPWFFYFDDTGALLTQKGYTDDLILKWCIAAFAYFDSVAGKAIPDLNDERHGAEWPPTLHLQQHMTVGARYASGLYPHFTLGAGNANADIEVNADAGIIFDEDLKHDILAHSSVNNIPVLYRIGVDGHWVMDATTPYLVRPTGTGRAAYNKNTAGVWSLAEVGNNKFTVAYLTCGPGLTKQWYVVMGQEEYLTSNAAEAAAKVFPNFGTLPAPEYKIVASVVIQTNDGYSNAVKSRVIPVSSYSGTFIDWRYYTQKQLGF